MLLALLGCRVRSTPEALVSVMQALDNVLLHVTLNAALQAFGLVLVVETGDKF